MNVHAHCIWNLVYYLCVSRTFRQECPMHISLCASEDGQTLEIKSLSLDHNHEINQVFFGLTCVADAFFTWLYTGTI